MPRVGVDDNFFEMGGHSLLVTQVISRLREAFGLDLPLRIVFQRPTLAALCLEITQLLLAEEDDDEMARLLRNVRGDLPVREPLPAAIVSDERESS